MSLPARENPEGAGGLRRPGTNPVSSIQLLDREPPAGYRAEWTAYLAKPSKTADVTTDSAMVFRSGGEWLALPTSWVAEVLPMRVIHSLPHRRGQALAGLVNVRGELVPCFTLERMLGIEPATGSTETRRLLVAGKGVRRLVLVADEIHGVLRYDAARLLASPARLAHVHHLLSWKERTVGLLDAEVLWSALERSLA